MSLREWARREIEIACKREKENSSEDEFSYGVACYESAYKAYESLLNDEHTGFSISITKNILNRLIEGKPLTPIEDTDDIWMELTEKDDYIEYQCNRMSSLFKKVYKDGRIEYHDINRVICGYKDNPDSASWYNGFVSNLIHEKYPITMPYNPSSKPFKVFCTEYLTDPRNGDYDTLGVLFVIKPDGTRDEIERFFKDSDISFVEIDKQEYLEREKADNLRRESMNMSNS